MKTLNHDQLVLIEAGSFLGAFCGVVGGAGAIAYLTGATIATGGAAGVVAGVVLTGCAAYGLYYAFS